MKRRLFINHLSAGLLLPFVPISLTAGNDVAVHTSQKSLMSLTGTLSDLIQHNHLGTPQQLLLTDLYSAGQMSLQKLRDVARQRIDLASRIVGSTLNLPDHLLFADSATTPFGTYSAQAEQDGLVVTWQCLARLNDQYPSTAPTSTLLISGSTGILRLRLPDQTYQLTDFQGNVVQTNG